MYVVMSSAVQLIAKIACCWKSNYIFLSSSATEKCSQVSCVTTFSYSPTLEAEVLD